MTKTSPEGNTDTFFPGIVDSSSSSASATARMLFTMGTGTELGDAAKDVSSILDLVLCLNAIVSVKNIDLADQPMNHGTKA